MNGLPEKERRFRVHLVVLAFSLFIVALFGLIYLATNPAKTLTMLLSFSGGISNIVLPCTLPLVFIIVPLAMASGGARKCLVMALLFGAGLTLMLSIYGAAIAQVGRYLGLDDATRVMYGLAGLAALVFGLSELKLIRFELPAYARMPQFIQKQGDYVKVFLLGLLLGNAGVGCPNPVTYIILTYAATTGDWFQGALLMAVNGIGRVVPLLFLTVLAILGINAMGGFTKRVEGIRKFTAWTLVLLGGFIIFNGVYGHLWYEGGIFHEGLNYLFMKMGGKMIGEAAIPIGELEKKVLYMEYGGWMNLGVTLFVVIWYWLKHRNLRKEVLTVVVLFLLWDFLLFDIGLDAMELAGLSEGLPEETEEMLKAMPWMRK